MDAIVKKDMLNMSTWFMSI